MEKSKLLFLLFIVISGVFWGLSQDDTGIKSNVARLEGATLISLDGHDNAAISNTGLKEQLVEPVILLPYSDDNLNPKYSFQQLEKMIYSGVVEQQLLAVEYLPQQGINSMPLLLYLANSKTDIVVKEHAVLALLTLEVTNIETILSSLLLIEVLKPLLSSLNIAESSTFSYLSPYQYNQTLTQNKLFDAIYQQLTSADEDERRQGITEAGYLEIKYSLQVLTEVLKYDDSEQIRREVQFELFERFPEQTALWLSLALQDESDNINRSGIDRLAENSQYISLLIPQLAQLIYSAKAEALKEKAIALLSNHQTLASEAIINDYFTKSK